VLNHKLLNGELSYSQPASSYLNFGLSSVLEIYLPTVSFTSWIGWAVCRGRVVIFLVTLLSVDAFVVIWRE